MTAASASPATPSQLPDIGAPRPVTTDTIEDESPKLVGDLLAPMQRLLRSAERRKASGNPVDATPPPAPRPPQSPVRLVRGDTVQPEPVNWLWPQWLAVGKLHILAGAPGTGKTTVCLSLAAAITSGGSWPDRSLAPVGDVLMWSGEDSVSDVLLPRLCAMGADRSRVHFVDTVAEGVSERPFDPGRHFPLLLQHAASLPSPRLLILDPIVSAITGDSHHNAEVRRGLQPLVEFARATGCAIVGVTHFSKGTEGRQPLDRVTGSLGFGAVARIVLGTVRFTDGDAHDRGLVRLKSNLGPDGGGFRYALELESQEIDGSQLMATRVDWGDALEGIPESIYSEAETKRRVGSALDDAITFLREVLQSGGVPFSDVRAAADAAGHSLATLRRAKDRLGIVPRKVGMEAGWVWELPPGVDAAAHRGRAEGEADRDHDRHAEDDHDEVRR